MKQTANDKSLGNSLHVARRPHDHHAIALELMQDDRPMYDLWALQRHRAATLRALYDYRKSLQSILGQN